MPSKYCGKLPRCKNAWWCATDYKPSKNVKCFDAMTNAERIRAMSDAELARFLYIKTCEDEFPQFDTIPGWIDWLKQEATE
jgi:hypothetical protein